MIGGLLKSTSSAALFAALGLMTVAGIPAAQAADLGGDCCADLEERVAELEATVARKGNRRVSLTISGQVTAAIMAWDAGGSIAAEAAEKAVDPSATTTTTTTTTTTVGPPTGFANIVPGTGDGGQVVSAATPGGLHIDPAHVHLGHQHAATSTSTSTSTTKLDPGKAAKAAKTGGRARDVYIVDPATAGGTLFSLAGNAKINPNVTAGFQIVMGLDTGARSHQVSQFDDDGQAGGTGGGDTTVVMTLANWYLDHKQLGKVSVGRINTATAGVSTVDLGGAGVIANASIGYWQRSFTDPESGQTWSALLGGNPVNGASLSRANAISYTSPTMGGFSVAGAWGENDVWDAALRYAGEFSGFRVAAAIGYIDNSSGLGDITEDLPGNEGKARPSQVKGSASVLHVASGLFLTGAYLNQDNDTAGVNDTTLYYVQGGVAKNWTGLGNTVAYGEWAQVDDPVLTGVCAGTICGVTSNMWGLGLVQHIDAASMEMFLSYRNFSADSSKEDFNDFDVVMGGARIRF